MLARISLIFDRSAEINALDSAKVLHACIVEMNKDVDTKIVQGRNWISGNTLFGARRYRAHNNDNLFTVTRSTRYRVVSSAGFTVKYNRALMHGSSEAGAGCPIT